MIGERGPNGIKSAKMITWVSVRKSEKCSAYSKVSTTPMEFDLPNNSRIFGIRSREDRTTNTSAASSVSVRSRGGYPTHCGPSAADMELDLPPFGKIFGWSIPNTEH